MMPMPTATPLLPPNDLRRRGSGLPRLHCAARPLMVRWLPRLLSPPVACVLLQVFFMAPLPRQRPCQALKRLLLAILMSPVGLFSPKSFLPESSSSVAAGNFTLIEMTEMKCTEFLVSVSRSEESCNILQMDSQCTGTLLVVINSWKSYHPSASERSTC